MHIKIEDLHKSFGGNHVLKGVNIEVHPGELCAIIGASGTGKSVLLKHIVGLIKPDRGRILVDGQDIVPLSEKQMIPIRRRFGMIFQSGGLLESMSLEENVGLGLAELEGESPAKIRETVNEKLATVGLEGKGAQLPATLSGGQRKRAAIARALTMKTDCFLYDEPTSGLDPIMADNIDEVILATNKDTNATTIVVTHDIPSVFRIAQRVYMLHGGVVVASGTPAEMRQNADPHVREFMTRELVPE